MGEHGPQAMEAPLKAPQTEPRLLHELVDYLRHSRTELREE